VTGNRAFEAVLLVVAALTVIYLLLDPWFPPRARWLAVAVIAVLSAITALLLVGVLHP
jgi:L-asparagine transporter-like permease